MNKYIFLLGIILVSFFYSCKPPVPPNMAGMPVPVNLYEVKMEVATYYNVYPGNVVALNEVQLRSELNGYVTGIFFKEGQTVRKGQNLYEVERNKYSANYRQADASVEIAKSNLDRAQKDAERYTTLGQQEAIAKQRVEYANTDFNNAKQQVTASEAQLSIAALDLKHSMITAPFDGTIGISPVKMGTFITAGQTILNTISSDDPIAVDFVISEKEIPRFVKLKDHKVLPGDSLFTILLPDKTPYQYFGQIELFDRAVDPQTGTLRIRLKFPNPKHMLKAGMSCDIRVLNNTEHAVVQVPFKAVTEQMGEYFVYVVERDSARQHKVILGPTVGANVVIFSGVNENEKIVVEGIQKLRDGAPVTLGGPPQAGPGGAAPHK